MNITDLFLTCPQVQELDGDWDTSGCVRLIDYAKEQGVDIPPPVNTTDQA